MEERTLRTEELVLIRERLIRELGIEDEWLHNAEFFMTELPTLYRRLLIGIRADIYGKTHEPPEIIRYPADWWQALKERFAPAWFRDRYPVVFIEHTITLKEIYPNARPFRPSAVMKLHKIDRENSCYDW